MQRNNSSKRQWLLWFVIGFWVVNLWVVVSFWANGSLDQMLSGPAGALIALGRLTGLLATFCALTQFILMGRVAWLEPLVGLDRLAKVHRFNGYAAISLMLTHPTLLTLGYSQLTGVSPIEQSLSFLTTFPFVWLAEIGLILFIVVVGATIYTVRKHLKFETWYFIHLTSYLAIALVFFHQLENGADFAAHPLFRQYWYLLYLFVVINLLIWRFSWPIYKFFRYRFRVASVRPETATTTSVEITGENFESYHAHGGQFVLVRFLAKGFWWQEHPFSLSRLPSKDGIRLTIRQLGDFTNRIPRLPVGTKVIVSGPYGTFTAERARYNKLLFIVGGVGITPIRSILEELAVRHVPVDAKLLYGNRNETEIIFEKELQELGQQLAMPIYHILSNESAHDGEKGYIDREKIVRLAPDVAQRDVFLCGPPVMMGKVTTTLHELGVPSHQVHYEQFALHASPLKK